MIEKLVEEKVMLKGFKKEDIDKNEEVKKLAFEIIKEYMIEKLKDVKLK